MWTKMLFRNQGPNYFYQGFVLFLCVSDSVCYVAAGILEFYVQFRNATRPMMIVTSCCTVKSNWICIVS